MDIILVEDNRTDVEMTLRAESLTGIESLIKVLKLR